MLPGVGVPTIILELSLFIGIALSGIAAGAQADKIKARVINEKISNFFMLIFPLKVGIAANYKEFPITQPEQFDAVEDKPNGLFSL
jgi:hypothetical protein